MPDFIRCATKFVFCRRRFCTPPISIVILCVIAQINVSTSDLEDEYNEYHGNTTDYKWWIQAKEWYTEDGEPMLRKFCAEAHKVSGKGVLWKVDWLRWCTRTLQFKNPKYVRRRVDVVQYIGYQKHETIPVTDSYDTWRATLERPTNKWAMVEGRRPDCVYYVNYDSRNWSSEIFSLQEEVCGIVVV